MVNRYLQLPEDFSEDIAELALDITDNYNNPYDKTTAITRYLRRNIEYSRTIPNRPNRADPIEWFLFETKTGFCNYYASSQVLMLRSLGIPARIGVGYAQGEYDPEIEEYIIHRLDSHAWPEVYFVDIGWVIFEPTTDQPAIILPLGDEEITDEEIPGLPEDDSIEEVLPEIDGFPTEEIDDAQTEEINPGNGLFEIQPIFIALILLTLILLSLGVWLFLRYRPPNFKLKFEPLPVILERTLIKHNKRVPIWLQRWRYRSQMSLPEKAYRQLGWSIRILGQTPNPAETPTERGQHLINLLPDMRIPVQEIINEYHLDQFSDHIINEERAKKAAQKIRNLAVKTRLQQIFKFLKA